MTDRVIAYVPDLMDRSRLGQLSPRFVPSPDELVGLVGAAPAPGVVVVVDLARPGALEAAAPLAADGVRVVGFVPHVDGDLRDTATAAGVVVVARSRFFADPGQVLAAD